MHGCLAVLRAADLAAAVYDGSFVQSGPHPQPSIYGAPSSATFSGAGNLVAPVPVVVKKVTKKTVKCKKGFVRNKKHKCVRSKSKKKAKKASRDRRTK